MFGFLSPLSNEKSFQDRWIGSPTLNRLGLHPARMLLSDLVYGLRCFPFLLLIPRLWLRLQRDGYVILPHFLTNKGFKAVAAEFQACSDQQRRLHPFERQGEAGFGQPVQRSGGFDRCDGDSINRFIQISRQGSIDRLYCRSWKLSLLTLGLFGMINRRRKHSIYELVHGNETIHHDPQRDLHRDTFHHTFKTWFYIEDVGVDDGPTEYVPGSNTCSPSRLRWEREESLRKSGSIATTGSGQPSKGGAFRIEHRDLIRIGHQDAQPLTIEANTLVIVDTRGFHRRGHSIPDTIRRSIYANFRPLAFLPILH